ncbi:MAG: 3'-5' exonuclease [Bacteroidales bacterium]
MMRFQSEISKEDVAELELIQYEGPIVVLNTPEDFRQEYPEIRSHPLLGFDTETRPSFKKGRVYPTALIQLAVPDKAWIVRVGRMGYPPELLQLLSNDECIKVGSGLQDDMRRMRADAPFRPAGFLDLQRYVEAFRIEEKGLKKMTGIVLGKRISKSQQVSNWEADVLTEAQLRYAATDAWICLEIYHALRNSISQTT